MYTENCTGQDFSYTVSTKIIPAQFGTATWLRNIIFGEWVQNRMQALFKAKPSFKLKYI